MPATGPAADGGAIPADPPDPIAGHDARRVHQGLHDRGDRGYALELFHGVRYGNWGGPGWSGGWWVDRHGGRMGPAPPVDSSDELYEAHDRAYDAADLAYANSRRDDAAAAARRRAVAAADAALVAGLAKLDADAARWPHPPPAGNEGDAEFMRIKAFQWFNHGRYPAGYRPPPATTRPIGGGR